jgi:hypothetical protein
MFRRGIFGDQRQGVGVIKSTIGSLQSFLWSGKHRGSNPCSTVIMLLFIIEIQLKMAISSMFSKIFRNALPPPSYFWSKTTEQFEQILYHSGIFQKKRKNNLN